MKRDDVSYNAFRLCVYMPWKGDIPKSGGGSRISETPNTMPFVASALFVIDAPCFPKASTPTQDLSSRDEARNLCGSPPRVPPGTGIQGGEEGGVLEGGVSGALG